MSASVRLVVILDRDETGVAVLSSIKAFTGAGLAEIRSGITAGLPVIVEEMYTNAWFDERAGRLFTVLVTLQTQGVRFRIWEASDEVAAELEQLEKSAGELTLDVLRNIIDSDDPGECQ